MTSQFNKILLWSVEESKKVEKNTVLLLPEANMSCYLLGIQNDKNNIITAEIPHNRSSGC